MWTGTSPPYLGRWNDLVAKMSVPWGGWSASYIQLFMHPECHLFQILYTNYARFYCDLLVLVAIISLDDLQCNPGVYNLATEIDIRCIKVRTVSGNS